MLIRCIKKVFVVSALLAVCIGEMPLLGLAQESSLTLQLQESPTPMTLLDVHFQDAQHGWVVGAGGTMLHTEDGGETTKTFLIQRINILK